MRDALSILEITSVPVGLRTLDGLTKNADVRVLATGTIEPGRYLVVLDGALDEVEEAYRVGRERAGDACVDHLLLSYAHPDIVPGLRGARGVSASPDCVGVVQGPTICSTVRACDKALKNAEVKLVRLRLSGGLGGDATFIVVGSQPDVEEAVDVAAGVLGAQGRVEVIARPSSEVLEAIAGPGHLELR